MRRQGFLWLFMIIFLVSCAPSAPAITPDLITIQYSFAAAPWLVNLSTCAGNRVIDTELRAADFQDPESSDLVMRLGQPAKLITPAYQIGTDDLLVIVNPQNPVKQLTADQVNALFTGRFQTWNFINGTITPVQVWVFPAGEDIQQVFEKLVLNGSPVTTLARLANSPEEMSQAVSNEAGSVGIITRRWKTKTTSDVFTAASHLPILVITRSEPRMALAQILACVQK
jgi:hypothetical protein